LPVITTEQNGSSEMIQNGVNGYLVKDAGCIADMTGHLNDFLSMGSENRGKMAKAAYKASLSYDWQKHVNELEQIFDKVAKEKAGL
jgi:glycosyltransferase involved in cell wall biosynthesis